MRFFICLLLVGASLYSHAQKEPSKWKTQDIVVNDPNVTIKASIQNNAKDVPLENNRIYAWYKSGKIIETQGGSHGRLLEGSYAVFYLNDQLKEKGSYKNGLKEGEWRTWDAEGRLTSVKNYKVGDLHGSFSTFDGEGRALLEAEYNGGQLHGESVTYENGKELSRENYRKGEVVVPKPPKPEKAAEPEAPTEPDMAEPKVKTKTKRTRQRTPRTSESETND